MSFPLYKTAAERQMEEKKVNARLKEIYREYFDHVWNERKERILSSGIDLHKFGWAREVSKKTGLTRKQVNLTVKRFPELAGKVFIRPSPGTVNKRETLGIYGANHAVLESEFCRRRDMILASGVDLTKCGWQKTLIACTERGIALCLQARLLGRWYGDDILHPIPMTEQMNKYIDRWRTEQCLCRINGYLTGKPSGNVPHM